MHKQHTLTQEHTPTIDTHKTTVCAHTLPYTQSISYLLADTHTPTQTHASVTSSFFPFSNKNTLSYARSRYICSTRQISLTATLAHATLILMGNRDFSDGSLYV